MSKPNEPIGEVKCPYEGCRHVCKVFKFRQRTEGRRSVFTGKLYADCPEHGRIGADGRQASQDYILEKGKIWGDSAPASGQAATTKKQDPKKPDPKPDPGRKPTEKKPDPKPDPSRKTPGWGPLIQ